MTVADLALAGVAEDLVLTEEIATEALQEAVAWRHTALVAMAMLAEMTLHKERLEQRLRQTMGFEPWHPEETTS